VIHKSYINTKKEFTATIIKLFVLKQIEIQNSSGTCKNDSTTYSFQVKMPFLKSFVVSGKMIVIIL
jgi:hypothetical protein